jgi:hypothetical protein
VEWTRNTAWRQGLLLDAHAVTALGLSHRAGSENTVVAVVTHDCDLAQESHGEPNVELLVGCLISVAEKDGNYTHAKSARMLHVEFGGEPALWAEFDATAKTSIAKTRLAPFVPSVAHRLSPSNLAVFQTWLASRYRRSAFPDEFERRLTRETKLAEKIAKAVRPHGDLITGVFFDVDGGEEHSRLGADDAYLLDVTILHSAEPDFMAAERGAAVAAAAIEKAFKDKLYRHNEGWQHIELRSCEVVSESVLTYQAFRQLKKWRLEHLSLAAYPPQRLLAE